MTRIRSLICAAIVMAGALFVSSGAFAQGLPLFAVLNGGNECNNAAPPLCRQGDLDGYGSATIIFPTGTSLCYAVVVDNVIGVQAAHIHRGVAGINSSPPVVGFPLAPINPSNGDPGTASGCVNGVAAALITQIRSSPSAFYVNVHSAAFPNGAVRGQLF